MTSADSSFLAGGGEMGALMRAHDWSATTLGSSSGWPQGLRTAVRLMLNTGHPMYIFWGADGACLYNDAYRQSIGPERHPCSLGRPAFEVWEEIWSVIGPQIEQVMAGLGSTWHENHLIPITRNGVREDVYWTYSYGPIDDESFPSGVGGVLVVCTETTEQVQARRRVVESEQRLQLALSGGRGIGTWDWDVPNDRVVADERFARLYGVDPAQAKVGAPVAQFFTAIHPDDLERVQTQIGEALRTGGSLSAEYRLLRPDGTECWVIAEGRCELAPDGSPMRLPGVSFDITERKVAEERLRELNAELERKVIERAQVRGRTWQVSPDLLGALNSQGYFETSNPAWQTLLGWSEHEVASMSIFELLHPDDVERTRGGFNLTQQGQPAIRFPNRYRCKDGSYRWISWVGVPEDGLVYCSGRDITEETQRAEALERAEDALRQSHKMEAVGQLTGGLAHDFNNLLAGISGNVELMARRISQGRVNEIERYLTAVKGAVKHAASLTHRLLAFSRRQTLNPRPTDINRLVGEMAELIRRTVGPSIRVAVVHRDASSALVDSNQLESVLLNLCINARDAMADGGKLTIETGNLQFDAKAALAHGLPPGEYASLSVNDTGIGMPADVAGRAFDPFFTTKPLGSGTGLGLSMAYGFVRQSGGHIRIDSIVGKGTTMSLYLPRYEGPIEAEPEREVRPIPTQVGTGEVVLVVDDEATVRAPVVEVLNDAGYAAIEACDGPSGLRLLQSDLRIDFLVTDVGLPGGMNGRQMADAGRLVRPHLKVLLITGYAEQAAIGSSGLATGMAVLKKPFGMELLLQTLGKMATAEAR